MLSILNFVQLLLYIPLLALAGQGALYVLAGPKRDNNFFYRLLQLLSKPFTALVRTKTVELESEVKTAPVASWRMIGWPPTRWPTEPAGKSKVRRSIRFEISESNAARLPLKREPRKRTASS